jgi:hypothetical protein
MVVQFITMGAKVMDNVLLALKASFLGLVLKIVIECSIMEWENDRKMDTGFRAKVVEQFGG